MEVKTKIKTQFENDTYNEIPNYSVNEHLAAGRSVLANERTYLAYVRTMVSLVAIGITLIKLFPGPLLEFVGVLFIVFGVFIFLLGHLRYHQMRRIILRETKNGHSEENN